MSRDAEAVLCYANEGDHHSLGAYDLGSCVELVMEIVW